MALAITKQERSDLAILALFLAGGLLVLVRLGKYRH